MPFADTLGQVLTNFIQDAVKNETSSPNYSYILFEAAALTLTYCKQDQNAFACVENHLTPALNLIIEQNFTDFTGYAFQLYSTFIANATELKPNYQLLCQSILENVNNWSKDMKYLIPALGIFVTTLICKFPDYITQRIAQISQIVTHLLTSEIRQEQVALKIGSAIFERIGVDLGDGGKFLKDVLFAIFGSLHFYRNNTKSKVIPLSIMRNVHSFFANSMICHGSEVLINACNQI